MSAKKNDNLESGKISDEKRKALEIAMGQIEKEFGKERLHF